MYSLSGNDPSLYEDLGDPLMLDQLSVYVIFGDI